MSIVKKFTVVSFFIVFICSMFLSDISLAQVGYSDEGGVESSAASEIKSDETGAAIEMGGSIEGVVVSVNPSSRSIVMQDTDEDGVTYNIKVKDSTSYFGIDSISDINIGDTVSVDIYSLDGYYVIAEEIVMEKRAYKEEKPALIDKVLID